MTDLTRWVYDSHVTRYLHPRQLTTHFHLNDPNGSGRAASVGTFKNLKHFHVDWDVDRVVDWATHHGWLDADTALLYEFAQGVQSGTRFHTGPVPISRPAVESWLSGLPTSSMVPVGFTFRRMKCCRGQFDQTVPRIPSRATFTLLNEE
jgi:hypothetical protein